MKVHLQGIALLAAMTLLLLGVARWAAPVLHEALGPEGAIQSTSSPDPPLGSPNAVADLPLTPDEVTNLQTILESINYDVGDIDGIIGPNTRAEIKQVKIDLKLPAGTSDRKLLERLIVLTTN